MFRFTEQIGLDELIRDIKFRPKHRVFCIGRFFLADDFYTEQVKSRRSTEKTSSFLLVALLQVERKEREST